MFRLSKSFCVSVPSKSTRVRAVSHNLKDAPRWFPHVEHRALSKPISLLMSVAWVFLDNKGHLGTLPTAALSFSKIDLLKNNHRESLVKLHIELRSPKMASWITSDAVQCNCSWAIYISPVSFQKVSNLWTFTCPCCLNSLKYNICHSLVFYGRLVIT